MLPVKEKGRKEKILETSIELFGKKGFQETSIQDIVSANDLTKGSFYYYFKSKEDVLVYIHERFINHLLHEQEMIIESATSNREKLEAVVKMLIANIRTNGNSAMVFFREMRHLSEERTEQILPKRHQFQRNIASILSAGCEAGEFRQGLHVDMLSFAVLGMANWSYFWFEPEGEISEDELTAIFMDMIFKGIEEDAS
ncbi:TetR/AcrR family transcriptional regulator [Halobacillus fulvus]|nr:TetR/AcrR family transcriptional regulator [Halobacillus fulvus]